MTNAPYRNSSLPVSERVADLLAKMTLEEKCAQLQSQIPISDKVVRRAEVGHVRDVAHFAHTKDRRRNAGECARIINADQKFAVEGSRLGIPVLQNEESLHGALWGDATMFPQCIALAATFNPELVQKVADVIGKELRAVGCRQTFAPVINMARDPRWGRAQETYGEDPYLSARMAVAYVRGVEGNGVVATPKHFVDNFGDGGRDSNAVAHSERYLREIDLVPFEAAIREGKARGIMASYNSIDGIPCSCNRWLLTDLLRGEWGFDGIVVSDYGGVWGLHAAHRVAADHAEASKLALESGMDVELPDGGHELLGLAQSGRLSVEVLDRAVMRVLRLKFELGLFDQPYVDPDTADRLVRRPESISLSLEAARQSIALLKNDNYVLPLSRKLRKIALFGPTKDIVSLGDYAGVFGGSWVGPGISPLEGIRSLLSPDAKILVHQAGQDPAQLASGCDAAIIFTAIREDEGGDRSDLDLPGYTKAATGDSKSQEHAIVLDAARREVAVGDQVGTILAVSATGVPTIVVLINGAAVTMREWVDRVPAIVEAWYAGEQGGRAIAEVLFGEVNPSGRLPVTFPRHVGQVPLTYDFKPSGRGYAYNDDDGKPQFPFGFGLSYTTFAYANLRLSAQKIGLGDSIDVLVDLTNTGHRAGDEVVQLYLQDVVASVARPIKTLRGFARVSLNPGETKTALFTLTPRDLSLWNAAMEFAVEPGTFQVMIGASAEDIRGTVSFEVRGH